MNAHHFDLSVPRPTWTSAVLQAGGVPGDPEEPGLPPLPSEPGEPTVPDQPPPAPVA